MVFFYTRMRYYNCITVIGRNTAYKDYVTELNLSYEGALYLLFYILIFSLYFIYFLLFCTEFSFYSLAIFCNIKANISFYIEYTIIVHCLTKPRVFPPQYTSIYDFRYSCTSGKVIMNVSNPKI